MIYALQNACLPSRTVRTRGLTLCLEAGRHPALTARQNYLQFHHKHHNYRSFNKATVWTVRGLNQGSGKNSSLFQNAQTVSGAHLARFSMGTGVLYGGGKATRARS
jgi:hypothetical protein